MSTHSTKWNRMNVNEPLRRAIQYVKETYYLSGVKLTPNIPKSVKSVYPEGWKQTTVEYKRSAYTEFNLKH